jgi:type II secretory pathway component PulJ
MVLSGNMRLPHQMNGWTEVEYVGWVMKHEALEDRLGMVEKAMEAEQQQRPQAGEKADDSFVKLLREVLEHARHVDGTPGI